MLAQDEWQKLLLQPIGGRDLDGSDIAGRALRPWDAPLVGRDIRPTLPVINEWATRLG